MEDNAQEDDQSSTDVASGDNSGSETDLDNAASEGDILDEDGSGENDDSAGSADDAEATDDEDAEDGKPKVVPIKRLRDVIEERNDLREQNKIFKTLLQQQGIKKEDGTKADAAEVKADLSKYTPRQLAEAKELLSGVLAKELGLVGDLATQVKELKKQQDDQQRAQFAQQDNAKLAATLKEFKKSDGTLEFKRSEVEAQVQAWHKSGDPELQALAKAPYRTILREMQAIRASKAGKKPKTAPRIPSDGDGGSDSNRFKPAAPKRERPNPSDSSGWEDRLAHKAHQMMSDKSADE